jgi:UDP-N-acetyl-D-mannosaminuronic acid dehydrogenase
VSDPNDIPAGPTRTPSAPHLAAVQPQYDLCVIGLGLDGVRIAARGASASMKVACCDRRVDAVARFNRAEVDDPLVETIEDALAGQIVRAFAGAARARSFIITTPPHLRADGSVDTRPIEQAIDAVVDIIEPGNVVVLDASAPPGTTRSMLAERLEAAGLHPGEDVFVASACVHDERCVIGGVTPTCAEHAAALYRALFDIPVRTATAESCELVRLAHRTHQEMNTAFANELSAVCKHLGLDVWSVLSLTRHAGSTSLGSPTPGPLDARARIEPRLLADACQHDTTLTRATLSLGDMQPARVVAEIRAAARRFVSPTIACLGLSSGGELRHSPAMRVASLIAREQLGTLVVVDPTLERSPLPGAPLLGLSEALRRADIVVLLSDEPSFAQAPRELYARPSVIDTLGVLAMA